MPTKIVAFECDVCKEPYTGKGAETDAAKCEQRETPEFGFEVGHTFTGKIGLPGAQNRLEIVDRKIVLSTCTVTEVSYHKPVYQVMNHDRGELMPGWVGAGKIARQIKRSEQR